ncbi:hypothetical protein KKF45_05350 [Patescibacteria group bacterium]|nr:hypothetical protein [Patescibacteria group bacterium]
MLKKYCRRYEIDPQEIDDTLSFWENKEHLQSIFMAEHSPSNGAYSPLEVDRGGLYKWESREAAWQSQMAEYLSEHTLENYIAHVEAGWTISEEVGEPYLGLGLFSLPLYIQGLG